MHSTFISKSDNVTCDTLHKRTIRIYLRSSCKVGICDTVIVFDIFM